jgi:DNA invertase Pin-like site-specific DNA recombinase
MIFMKIGYIRVSTKKQHLHIQEDALKKYNCDKIYRDIGVSGSRADRKGLSEALEILGEGDSFIVWRLDRAFRSVKHLLNFTALLEKKSIKFVSLEDNIDTNTSMGKLFFNFTASINQFQRDLAIERTKAGLESARARGRFGGRPKKISDKKIKALIDLYETKKLTVNEIIEDHDISRTTFYRRLESLRKK